MRLTERLAGHRSDCDWFIAWFCGSAVTAFCLHNAAVGWIFTVLTIVALAAGIGAQIADGSPR